MFDANEKVEEEMSEMKDVAQCSVCYMVGITGEEYEII